MPVASKSILIRAAAIFTIAAAASAQEIALRPALETGDEFELEFIRAREDSRRPQANGRSRTVVRVRVSEAGPKGFVLDWQQGVTEFDNPEIVKNPIAAAAANGAKDMRLEIVLGPDGRFTGLRNQAEVTAKMQSALDSMLASVGKQVPDAKQRQAVETVIRRLMSPQLLLSAAASDVQTYFGLNGAVLTKGKPTETEIRQQAPVGITMMPARFRLTLDSLDAHEAKLSSTTAYDPQALAAMAKDLLAQAAPGAAPPPNMEMSDTGRYVFNRAFGLMNEMIIARRITAGEGAARLDGREIRLITRPKR